MHCTDCCIFPTPTPKGIVHKYTRAVYACVYMYAHTHAHACTISTTLNKTVELKWYSSLSVG